MATKKTDLRKTSKRNAQPVLKKTSLRAETKRSVRQTLRNKETIKDLKTKIATLERIATFPKLYPTPVLEVSSKGHILFANKAASATLKGLGLKDNLKDFLPDDTGKMLKLLKRGERKQFRRIVNIKDSIFGEVIYLAPEFDSIRIYAHDITERKRAEDKLRRLQAELAQAARLSTLGEMAKSLAHELNQPLTAIVTYAQACLNLLKAGGEHTKQLTGALEQVVAEGLRAGEVIRRTRTLAQTRSSRWETLDLNVMIRDIVAFVAWKARQYAVSIRLELADNLPPLTLDITQIQQILLNLLNNSIEMLSAHCKERRITLSTSATDATVEIAVADSGPGLSSADLEDLFNSFFTAKPDKVGVGLALSRSLAEAQGGRLRAAPNPEHGNTFYLTLPLHQKIPSDET